MKIVLVRPRFPGHVITPPLGLGYLASYLKAEGIQAVIIDALRENLPRDRLLQRIAAEKPDAAGITCITSFYGEVAALSKELKARGIPVIVGGIHPTFLPESTLQDTGADFVICGEGEAALLTLLSGGLSGKGIQGVYSRESTGEGRTGHERAKPVENLDDLPFPDWHQMEPRWYPRAPHSAVTRGYPIGVVAASRGCPCHCTFCASPAFYGGRVRFRSPESVVDEMEYLARDFGVREIHFEDDNLTLDRARLEEMCRLIGKRGLKIAWSCPNGIRCDMADGDLLRLMAKSGCYYVAFGVESFDQGILDNVKKNIRVEQITRSIKAAKEAGLVTQGFFIFGLPGETRQTIETTIQMALGSGLDRAQFSILDVLPGCELWDTLKGSFKPRFQKNSFKEPEWLPGGVSREDLMAAQSRAFRAFYLRPGTLWGILRSVHPSQLPYLLHRLLDYRIPFPAP
jgi:radical SAM superfamily enzyme YgiQ (UPF0313 family)